MVSLLQFSQLPMTFIVPILAGKVKDQRWIVVGVAILYLLGYGGIMAGGTALVPLWMIMIGIAGGAAFGLVNDVLLHYAHGHHMKLQIYQVWHSLSATRLPPSDLYCSDYCTISHPVGQFRC